MPFAVGASMLLLAIILVGNDVSRFDGLVLLAFFAMFMVYTFRVAMQKDDGVETSAVAPVNVWKSLLYVVAGLGALIVGSNLFVDSASDVARQFDISEGVIGLTIVAGGTSRPELATSVVAARKGQSAIAIGNVIGSNVFNILLILGLTATISPMVVQGITVVDLAVMLLSVLMVWGFAYTKYTVARWEGAVLTAVFVAYMGWLMYNL